MISRLIVSAALCAGVLFGQIQGMGGGYSGPSVLAGQGSVGRRGGEAVDLRFFGDVTGIYDSGQAPVATDASGNLLKGTAQEGVQVDVGLYGTKEWRRDLLGIDYKGSYRHYNHNSYYDGSDQSIALQWTHKFNRRFNIEATLNGGTSTLPTGFLGQAFTSPDALGIPTTDIFNNRTTYVSSDLRGTYRLNARWTVLIGGNAFAVRRQSKALVGVDGYGSNAGIAYQASRRSIIQTNYQFLYYSYPRAFGQSYLHIGSATYNYLITKRWTVHVNGGAIYADTEGLQSVSLDPAISALLGQSTIIEAFHRRKGIPTFGAGITGHYKYSSISFDYTRGSSPGNGVYLTSRADSGTATYAYTGFQRWNLSLHGSYQKLTSIGQNLGAYSSYSGGGAASYVIGRSLQAVSNFEVRQNSIANGYNRETFRASIGVAFSPGDIPLALW